MAHRFDDELPEAVRVPQPHGWYELFCCSGILFALVAVLLFLGLYH